MNADEVTGSVLSPLCAAALAGDGRGPLYPALLVEPLLLAFLSHEAAPGPSVRLTGGATTRMVESPALRVPAVPLYLSATAMRAAALDRGYWPDSVERASVFDKGTIFPILRGQAGAILASDDESTLALDAGELAALADRQTPEEYQGALKALVTKGRGREAAQRLAKRPLYVLGHPHGGMMLFQREIAAFLHLATAEKFAIKLATMSGERGQHGLVAGADLFKNAFRGKLQVHVEPGPQSFRLRPIDMR